MLSSGTLRDVDTFHRHNHPHTRILARDTATTTIKLSSHLVHLRPAGRSSCTPSAIPLCSSRRPCLSRRPGTIAVLASGSCRGCFANCACWVGTPTSNVRNVQYGLGRKPGIEDETEAHCGRCREVVHPKGFHTECAVLYFHKGGGGEYDLEKYHRVTE